MDNKIYKAPDSYYLIYVYELPGSVDHAGLLKVGDTSFQSPKAPADLPPDCEELREEAKKRIKQQTNTAGLKFKLHYAELAVRTIAVHGVPVVIPFRDHEVHDVLEKSGFKHVKMRGTTAREWYKADLDTIKKCIVAVKEGRIQLNSSQLKPAPDFVFRAEQEEAIKRTLARFKKHYDMLWNAKMRFGKTPTALEVVLRGGYQKTIIITHRPVVGTSWKEDYLKIFPKSKIPYEFVDKTTTNFGGSTAKAEADKKELLTQYAKAGKHFIYFASIQDLRGSSRMGGEFPKNDAVFDTKWDLVIVDEAHEGTQTELGKKVSAALTTKDHTRVLSLSGTPFNILSSYDDDAVFVWDYTMEQATKLKWEEDHPGEPNPYAVLPRMNIYTFDLTKVIDRYEENDLEGKAFNFAEFFRTWTGERDEDGRSMPAGVRKGDFVHADDVRKFLDLISSNSTESRYPFSTPEFCDFFRHSLWMVPGVASARALSKMLQEHPIFKSFGVANVAGEGDDYEEEHYDNALAEVREKIKKYPRTITLSCGKLTTGVTVPEWTAVLMIAGSVHTAASSYMQTIFRVQSPWVHDGRCKEECYVFDFAPDRTLTVLTEAAQLSRRIGKDDEKEEKGKAALTEFLNYCSVLSIEGGRAVPYDVQNMMRRLKHVFVMKAIRNGFDDPSLYNNAKLLKLGKLDLMKFNDLERIVGKTKQTESPNSVDINSQHFDQEEYEKRKEEMEKKKGRKLTPEEMEALKKHREELKKARDARSILRAISIRMPLLIYGADVPVDETITLKKFVAMVDNASWVEFMPQGITKARFNDFIEYYDSAVFEAAGLEIRKLAKAADKLPPGKRVQQIAAIFSYFKNPDKETVLTPWRVVNMHMSDTLGGWCFWDFGADRRSPRGRAVAPRPPLGEPLETPVYVDQPGVTDALFGKKDAKILEINSKSGLYPLYVAYSLYRRKCGDTDEADIAPFARLKHWKSVVENQLFVVCKTKMAVSITRRTLVGYDKFTKVNARTYDGDLIATLKDKPEKFTKTISTGTFWGKEEKEMKFDAVVGNPPYQMQGLNEGNRDNPIYHMFMDAAFTLSQRVSLITPGRFLFDAGQTPKAWNSKMLNDSHLKVVRYWENSGEVFPNVDIKGGVVITYRDTNKEFGRIGIFSKFGELNSIMNKVLTKENGNNMLDSIVSSQGIFRFSTKFLNDNPKLGVGITSKGTGTKIVSKEFETMVDVFKKNRPSKGDYVELIGRMGGARVSRFIRKDWLEENDYLDGFKVYIPEANGTGTLGEVLSTPCLGNPKTGSTDTFICIGPFLTANEAENCLRYIKTRFARALLGILKVTQHNTKSTWRFVPIQDFTEPWDDAKLYKKYGITKEEQAFIESMIKPME